MAWFWNYRAGRENRRSTCYKDGGSTEGVQEGAALFPANKIKVHLSAPTGGRGPVITRNYSPSGLIGGFAASPRPKQHHSVQL